MSSPRLVGMGQSILFLWALGVGIGAGSPPPGQTEDQPVRVPGPEEHPGPLLAIAEKIQALRNVGRGPGVPDYAAVAARQRRELPELRRELEAISTEGWSVHSKVDYLLLRSELNSLDFSLEVWRPTTRNPSFYVNEAIGRVGRHFTGGRYLRGDLMPYEKERARAILEALAETEEILEQGRRNLAEMVPELADIALRHPGGGYYVEGGELEHIEANYAKWARLTAEHFPEPEASELVPAAARAARALREFGDWLRENRSRMTGSYAIGDEALNWYTRNVLMMPYDADELLLMAEMERARSISSLQFEMQKNRYLPPIEPAKTYKEYLDWDDETALILRRWYTEEHDILSDRSYMLDVRSEEGLYLPPFGLIAFPEEEKPGVKRILLVPVDHWRAVYSNMGFRTDPGVLHGHEYWPGHYYEGEIRRRIACPIRRSHRDGGHSQGWCFYHEELPVLLDFPFVRGPRARELVYINMLQRAERILLGVRVLRGEMSPDEAMEAFRQRVPPLGPGLGARREEAIEEIEGVIVRGLDHCQTGKLQIFKLLADRKMQLKEKFDLKEFHDQLISLGSVPISLLRWEIAGLDDEASRLWKTPGPILSAP